MLEYVRMHENCIADCRTYMLCLLRGTELNTQPSGSKSLLNSWRWWVETISGSFDAQQDAFYKVQAILDAIPVTYEMELKREDLLARVSFTHRTYFEKWKCCDTAEATRSMDATILYLPLPGNRQEVVFQS